MRGLSRFQNRSRLPRVLLVTPWPPYPFDGGSKRIHSLCHHLRNRFRFSLLSFLPEASSQDLPSAAEDLLREHRYLRPVFERIHWVRRDAGRCPDRVDGITLPPDVRRFFSSAMTESLRDLVSRGEADLVHFEYDLMAPHAFSLRGVPLVLTQHDMGGLSFFRSYFREMAGIGKFANIPRWLRRMRFMRRAGGWFDRFVVMTTADRQALGRFVALDKVRAIPTGVDVEHFAPEAGGSAPGESLVYVGHYPHYPNEDAVLYFCRKILPLIRAARSGVKFYVVGSSPTPPLERLSREDPGVIVTGTVNDVKPYLSQAAVFVAPIRLGEGIKGKILEAFSMGLPVVATSRAAAGLEADPGRDLIAADRPGDFAGQVLRLLDSPRLREELGSSGRRIAQERYGWRSLAPRLGDLYDELL